MSTSCHILKNLSLSAVANPCLASPISDIRSELIKILNNLSDIQYAIGLPGITEKLLVKLEKR